jgi:hypothetical protein
VKDIYFLSGVFRCGNTLLRSILNQNPNIYLSSNSLTPEIVYRLHLIKDSFAEESNNHKFLENVIKNTFNNYYKDIKKDYIIDQGRWGTPGNCLLLKKYKFLPKKFIFLVRPLEEIVGSWITLERPLDVYSYCDTLFSENGRIGQAALALSYLTKNYKKNLHIIKYKNLCKNPQKTIKDLYDFLNIPHFNHRFKNLDQVDTSLAQTTIRTNVIKQKKYNYKKIVPREILEKHKEINEMFKKYGT